MNPIDPLDPNLSAHDHDRTAIDLEETLAAVDGGVTGLTPSTATALIERWELAIQESRIEGLDSIVANLRALREELAADRLDGAAIGGLLAELGEGTERAAADAQDERLTPLLERLGSGLRRAGAALGAE